MSVRHVNSCDDIYCIDTKMLGHDEYTAAYIVDGDEVTIVDTGLSTATDRILDALDELGIDTTDVETIALTHIHLDHAGAAGFLAERCPNARVLCHERGIEFLSDEERLTTLIESVHRAVGDLADRYGTATPIPEERFTSLSGGETVSLGDRELEVIAASGHAPHQVCYYETKNQALFTADECGEYLGGELLPTTPPPNFDLEKNIDSLHRLAEYDVETLLYPHFGPKHDVDGTFEEYEAVLREWVEEVEAEWEEHRDRQRVVEAFQSRDHPHPDQWDDTSVDEVVRMDVEGALRYVLNRND